MKCQRVIEGYRVRPLRPRERTSNTRYESIFLWRKTLFKVSPPKQELSCRGANGGDETRH